jgi:hypothetical protein
MLHNKKFSDLYMSDGENKKYIHNFEENTSLKVAYGRQRNKREDNIEVVVVEVDCEGSEVDRIGSGSCTVVGFVLAVLNFRTLLPQSYFVILVGSQ